MERRKQLPHIKTPDEFNDNLQKDQAIGGEKIYSTYCASCHQRNGKGAEGRFPPLVDVTWVKGDKTTLINVLLNGLEGNIEVNGVGYNGVMPKHAFLTDEEAAGVLTYIRQKFGNMKDEITVDEVSEQRKKIVVNN
jgi:mono/diheme cytochrome c family protein